MNKQKVKQLIKSQIIPMVLVGLIGITGGYLIASKQIKKEATAVINQINVQRVMQSQQMAELKNQIINKTVKFDREIEDGEDGFYKGEGDRCWQLTDGSWILVNEEKGEYIFQPVALGDWDYELDNIEQLKNIVATYIECSNYDIMKALEEN